MDVTIRMTGVEEVLKRLSEFESKIKDAVKKEVNIGLLMIETNAKRRVQQGAKTGRVYEKYKPRRTHRASAEGQSPASDTGYLAENIKAEPDVGGLSGSVVSHAGYSFWLEYDPHRRPFMFPAMREEEPKIYAAMINAIKKATDDKNS